VKYYDTDLVAEVRRNREEMLEERGGYEGYTQYLAEQRPNLEAAGWYFASPDDATHERKTEIYTSTR